MSQDVVIKADKLCKWYGKVIGLNEVSFELGSGVIGVLGPNGAGKTTLLRLITGQIAPSLGKIQLLGQPVMNNWKLLQSIGYCPEIEVLFEELTGIEFISYLLKIRKGYVEQKKIDSITKELALEDIINKRISNYSRGMRQRVKFASAIAHEPEVIILDEPLNGADPVSRQLIIKMIIKLGENGKTVLVSSHILHEIESMTSKIMMLNRGSLIAFGEVYTLRKLLDKYPQKIKIECSEPRKLGSILSQNEEISGINFENNNTILIEASKIENLFEQIPLVAIKNGITINSLTTPDHTLEALFKYLSHE